jgi:hypothetical protein
MWPKSYKDYPVDQPLIQNPLEPGKGIIGCEMDELNGWGDHIHFRARKKKKGIFTRLMNFFKRKKK